MSSELNLGHPLLPWAPVQLEILSKFNTIPVDLYVSLGETKFVKIYIKNDDLLKDVVEKYSKKNITVFYCRSQEFGLLSKYLTNQNIELNPIERIEIIKEVVSTFGISEFVANNIQKVTEETVGAIKDDKDISSYVQKMLSRGDYLSQHSMIVPFFACLLAKEMDWSSSALFKKLSFAGVLHDMLLSENILEVLNGSSLEHDDLSWKEKKIYTNHTSDTINLIEKSSKIPFDVIDIISNHHAYSLDSSLPNSKSVSAISQVNALFILADEFAHNIHFKTGIDLDILLSKWNTFHEYFNKGNFRKPLKALEKLVAKHKSSLKKVD